MGTQENPIVCFKRPCPQQLHFFASSQASRAYNLQAQQMSALTSELNHATAELGSMRLRMETNASTNANNLAAAQQVFCLPLHAALKC